LVLLLALTLAGPVRQFLAGRAELVELAAERSRLEQRAQDLQDQLARQADPAYTARQARQRLTYVLPGDRLVGVVDGRLAERDARGELPTRSSAGGMPDRVKCPHALAGHALAAGPGVNPIGDRAVAEMGEWWASGPCVVAEEDRP